LTIAAIKFETRKELAQQLHPEVLKLKEGCEEANLKAGL
jgi:hypothetical protein